MNCNKYVKLPWSTVTMDNIWTYGNQFIKKQWQRRKMITLSLSRNNFLVVKLMGFGDIK